MKDTIAKTFDDYIVRLLSNEHYPALGLVEFYHDHKNRENWKRDEFIACYCISALLNDCPWACAHGINMFDGMCDWHVPAGDTRRIIAWLRRARHGRKTEKVKYDHSGND